MLGKVLTKKRISDRNLRAIANERITTLMGLARSEAYNGNVIRSRRYNDLANRVAMRCRVSMPYGLDVCRDCFISLVPGKTSRVRLGPCRIVVQCTQCGSYRRIPYIKEKERMAKCQQGQEKM
jgi:ribonuclease P protein subunit RPR2